MKLYQVLLIASLAVIAMAPLGGRFMAVVKRISMAALAFLTGFWFLKLAWSWCLLFGLMAQIPGYTWPNPTVRLSDVKNEGNSHPEA